MAKNDSIVFEDLHGVGEEEPVTVDLDIDTKDDGITRTPADEVVVEDDVNDDDDELDVDASDDDDSDDGDEEGDDASSVDEDDDYSKRVKARIEREKRVTAKERERAQYWENQAKELAKGQYKRDKESLEGVVEQADSAIERTRTDLKRAIEDGDTDRQVELTDDLTNWKAKKARAEANLETLSPEEIVQPYDDRQSDTSRQSSRSEAEKWVEKRGDWYRQAGFERATRLANRLDREVAGEGFDPRTPQYFAELDRRLIKEMPELYDELDDGKRAAQKSHKRPQRSPVAPVGNESRQSRERSSKVKLGKEDFANMRNFGLDTNDPEVLKEYARNKVEPASRRVR